MRRDTRSGVLVATLLCGGAWSDVARAADTAPDVGFLEYLGGLVQQDGKWVGPDDMGVAEGTTAVADVPQETEQAPAILEPEPPINGRVPAMGRREEEP